MKTKINKMDELNKPCDDSGTMYVARLEEVLIYTHIFNWDTIINLGTIIN